VVATEAGTHQGKDLHEAPEGEEDREEHRGGGGRFARDGSLVRELRMRRVAVFAEMGPRLATASIAPQVARQGVALVVSLRQLLVLWCAGSVSMRLVSQRVNPVIGADRESRRGAGGPARCARSILFCRRPASNTGWSKLPPSLFSTLHKTDAHVGWFGDCHRTLRATRLGYPLSAT
jgi:hypothetical protein